MKQVFENKLRWLVSLMLAVAVFMSCDSDDPDPVDEPELITTMTVTFTNADNASDVVVARFRDLDGPGGNDGTFEHPTLTANASYTVTVAFLNESETPAEDITEEVKTEDEAHQVFFIPGTGLNFTYAYDDTDGMGNPLGLMGTGATTMASTGTLAVVLVHEPVKDAAGVSDGDITNAGGEEDIRVTFNVTIQ